MKTSDDGVRRGVSPGEPPRIDSREGIFCGPNRGGPGDTAAIGYIPHDARWSVYATGYRDAADIVANWVQTGGRHQDFLVYPIIYLYRHYLELRIKQLIFEARDLKEDRDPSTPDTHDIAKLWNVCRTLLEGEPLSYRMGRDAGMADVELVVSEMKTHDPDSSAFRYPYGKPKRKTQKRTPLLAGLKEVNLVSLGELMESAGDFLDGVEMHIDHLRECIVREATERLDRE